MLTGKIDKSNKNYTDNGSGLGLVFSGGGGKGAYEIGAWRALEEFGVASNVAAISGASIGSLNAALFAQRDLAKAEYLWGNMTQDDVLHMTPEKAINIVRDILLSAAIPATAVLKLAAFLKRTGVFSREGLLKLMGENLDFRMVTKPALPIFATVRRKGTRQIKHYSLVNETEERVRSILLASSAIPVVFPPEKIDGGEWFDGGFPNIKGSNTPIAPVYKHGCKMIIAIMLDMEALVDISAFPDATILFVYPQASNGGLISGAMDFDGIHAARRMDQGYEDAVRILEPIYRMGVASARYTAALEIAESQQEEFAVIRREMKAAQTETASEKKDAEVAIESLRSMEINSFR